MPLNGGDKIILDRNYNGQNAAIKSDSQAAIGAVRLSLINSKMV